MLEFGEHGVLRLSIRVRIVFEAQQIAAKGHCQRHLAAAGGTAEHHGMGQTVFLDHLYQALLHLLLSYDFAELHFFSFSCFTISTTESTAPTV